MPPSESHITLAKAQAKKSTYLYRLGAIALNKGRVVSRGFNQLKTHPRFYKEYNFFSLHAEVQALNSIDKCDTIIVVRIRKNESLTMARPCDKCLKFMSNHGVRRVIFSNWDGTMEVMLI